MSETEKQNPEENVVAEDQIPDDLVNEEAAEEATVDTASAAEEAKSDAVRVAELDAQNAQLTDKLLRTMADMENLRNRTRRDKEDAIKYAPQKLVTDLIGVMDNLQRALSSVSEETAEGNEDLKTLRDGVEMTNREMLKVFEKHNITEVEAMGARMDPHSHEALFEIPDPSQPEGTILQVIQPGFRLHDRLLRPARVGVAKGGPVAGADKVDTTA
ncbi:nucleotide exchange factor GrpE [uncultured Kiloniella sp.]|uniref:nucleotide exchange factor GrpE n=1 Tax=uncultured Kiloniella sp. TaxID=1133091 RepID=UPI002608CC7E|nr:nucleotide exchange factor GrpE [uncultured Kiloniella sp.]